MKEIDRNAKELKRLLANAGSRLDVEELQALVTGVVAAPAQPEPAAWLRLVARRPGVRLGRRLVALRDEIARGLTNGLDGRRSDPARLAALRRELKRRKLDGFIVPRSDEHQGEYVARRAERLAWLTGFTGSAGVAVVLSRRAAVFVDGRYTLQGKAEVDESLYGLRHVTDVAPTDWIIGTLGKGARLGYDPWLHTPNQVARYRAACKAAGAELVPTRDNPVDRVWTDQPAAPIAPIVPHPLRFTGEGSARKRRRMAAQLGVDGTGAVVLSAPDSIAWLLNVRGGDVPYTPLPLSFAVLYADGRVDWMVDERKLTPGVRRHLGRSVRIHPPAALGALLDRLGAKKTSVRVANDRSPSWVLARIERAGAVVVRGPDPCQLAKARKNPVELEGIRRAHRRDGTSLTAFLAWLAREGPKGTLTEMTAARRLEAMRRGNEHFRGLSFPTISGAGPDGAIVHYRVTESSDRRIRPGMLYLVDSGAQYLDGTTDVTRTVAIGRPKGEMRRNFTRVLRGHIAVATARFPKGTTGSQLDPWARRALWEAGLDYDHGTGHGVGAYLGVHEGPHRMSKLWSDVALAPGMVVSNEPGYYKAGAYGIRVENLVEVVDLGRPRDGEHETLGFETLTLAPIDLALVEQSMMTADEVGWLDAYHARVRKELSPLVDKETEGWLGEATRPLAPGTRRSGRRGAALTK